MPDILSIFPVNTNDSPTTAEVIAKEIIQISNAAAQTLVDLHQKPFNKLWKRSLELGVDPQEVLDILGENGPVLFSRATELVQFILGMYNNTPIAEMAPNEYTPPYDYYIKDNHIVLTNKL